MRSLGMSNNNNGPPNIQDTRFIGKRFFPIPTASSSTPYPQESDPWISNVSEHMLPHVMSGTQKPVQDVRCQFGPSTKDSVIPSERGFCKNLGQTNNDCRSQIFILCCNYSVLNLVSTCFVFFIPCPIAVAMMFHVQTIVHTIFRLSKLECFRHVLQRIQVFKWCVLRTTQNGDFVLFPLCVAPCGPHWRFVGAMSLGWRRCRSVGAVAPERVVPSFRFLLRACALLLNIHLDSSDHSQAISFKQIMSTAPS